MDSVDILWTNTPQLIDDPFILGMNVIKSGFLSLIKLIKANDKIKMKSVAQDKTKEIFRGSIKKINCLLCKPQTYMNISGSPIREIASFYKIPKSKILIIHDDLCLLYTSPSPRDRG